MDLKWESSAISLKDAIKASQFPVVAKVNEACEIIDGKTLKKGELITIHGRRTVVKFHGFDNNGSEIFIPANSGVKARLRVPADSAIYDTVKDICLVSPAPKFVEITRDREHGTQQNALKAGDRLKVLLVERNGDGPTHMHFRNQTGKHVRLPADFEGPFKPCSEDNQVHSLLELAKHPLPFTLEVVPDCEDKTSQAKLNGIVQIIDILTEDIALTSVQHKKIYAVVLPINTSKLSLFLPEEKNDDYEELSDHFKSNIDVNVLQSYVDKQCSTSKTSTLYSPYETISQIKLSKKEKRLSQLKTASLGSRHDVKLHPIKAASKLLKSKKSKSTDAEDKKEVKVKASKSKSLKMFKDKKRKKSEAAEARIDDNQNGDPGSPGSEDRCSIASSPSPAEERKMTSIDESDGEGVDDTKGSDTDEYDEPLPSPSGTKSKTNTLIGRMWKKVKAQKTKSASSLDGSVKIGNEQDRQQSGIISGELYTALEQYDDEGLYEEIGGGGQMAYESLDIFQEAKRAIGMSSPPISTVTENSGDSGFLDLQRSGGRHSNSPLPPLPPPNHPLEKPMQRCYSEDDIYLESDDQLTANQLQTFYEAVKKSEQEIAQWSSEELSTNLTKLQLSAYINKFNDSQIDGGLLIDLDEAVFKDLGMSSFEARKLRKFVFGWRPDAMKKIKMTENDNDATTWSGAGVAQRLTSIGMSDIAKFCKSNQVNGDLLKDIVVDDQIMNDILSGVDKRLKSIKLRNYVIESWRPRLKSEATALTEKKKLKSIKTDEIDIGERKSTPPHKRSVHKYVAPVVTPTKVTSSAPAGSRIANIKQQLLNNAS